jgi:hypothetical protein
MRFLMDFNEIEHDQYIWADVEDAEVLLEGDLRVGRTAELTDGVAHWCVGIITEIDSKRGLIRLVIDWQTWRSMRHPRRELVFPSYRDAEYYGQLLPSGQKVPV